MIIPSQLINSQEPLFLTVVTTLENDMTFLPWERRGRGRSHGQTTPMRLKQLMTFWKLGGRGLPMPVQWMLCCGHIVWAEETEQPQAVLVTRHHPGDGPAFQPGSEIIVLTPKGWCETAEGLRQKIIKISLSLRPTMERVVTAQKGRKM